MFSDFLLQELILEASTPLKEVSAPQWLIEDIKKVVKPYFFSNLKKIAQEEKQHFLDNKAESYNDEDIQLIITKFQKIITIAEENTTTEELEAKVIIPAPDEKLEPWMKEELKKVKNGIFDDGAVFSNIMTKIKGFFLRGFFGKKEQIKLFINKSPLKLDKHFKNSTTHGQMTLDRRKYGMLSELFLNLKRIITFTLSDYKKIIKINTESIIKMISDDINDTINHELQHYIQDVLQLKTEEVENDEYYHTDPHEFYPQINSLLSGIKSQIEAENLQGEDLERFVLDEIEKSGTIKELNKRIDTATTTDELNDAIEFKKLAEKELNRIFKESLGINFNIELLASNKEEEINNKYEKDYEEE